MLALNRIAYNTQSALDETRYLFHNFKDIFAGRVIVFCHFGELCYLERSGVNLKCVVPTNHFSFTSSWLIRPGAGAQVDNYLSLTIKVNVTHFTEHLLA